MRLFYFISLMNNLCSDWMTGMAISWLILNTLNKRCFVESENIHLFWHFVCDIASQNILFWASLFQLKWFVGNSGVVSTGFPLLVKLIIAEGSIQVWVVVVLAERYSIQKSGGSRPWARRGEAGVAGWGGAGVGLFCLPCRLFFLWFFSFLPKIKNARA